MTVSGMASQLETVTLKLGADAGAISTLAKECLGTVPVFGDLTDSGLLTNDFYKILSFQPLLKTTKFYLLDGKCNVLTELNDDTFGTYYPVGFLNVADGFTAAQSLLIGYQLEWREVLNAFGPGLYQLKTVVDDVVPIGGEEEQVSCLFDLNQYTSADADGTVRVNLVQNGKVISDLIDYTGVNWVQQYRFKGFFGEKQRKLEKDDYKNKNRVTTQIQDSVIYEYTLQPYLLTPCLRTIIDEILLANDVIISDYNLLNTDNLKDISVNPVSVDTEYFADSPKAADEFKFEERRIDRVKRNVR